jgi:hypothetical protein
MPSAAPVTLTISQGCVCGRDAATQEAEAVRRSNQTNSSASATPGPFLAVGVGMFEGRNAEGANRRADMNFCN